jgi:Icc protein
LRPIQSLFIKFIIAVLSIDDFNFHFRGQHYSAALWDLLVSLPQVKASVHGHLHQRSYSQHRGIHIVDTPATSFVRRPEENTTGWTMGQLSADGVEFTTLTHAQGHALERKVETLGWR